MSAPEVPTTPSKTINEMLKSRCGKKHDNPVFAALAQGICRYFAVTTQVYTMIHPDQSQHSHRMWMASCALVSLIFVLGTYLGYHTVVALSYIAHTIVYYAAYAVGLMVIALGVSGAVFFDKEGGSSSSTTPRSTYSSTPSEYKSE